MSRGTLWRALITLALIMIPVVGAFLPLATPDARAATSSSQRSLAASYDSRRARGDDTDRGQY